MPSEDKTTTTTTTEPETTTTTTETPDTTTTTTVEKQGEVEVDKKAKADVVGASTADEDAKTNEENIEGAKRDALRNAGNDRNSNA